jgi:hypothetical protein
MRSRYPPAEQMGARPGDFAKLQALAGTAN